jgi:ketosteroid isomerase-like protein
MTTIDFPAAETGIRQLYARYADAVWRQDSAVFGECFTGDAVWKIAGKRVEGRAAIADLFEASLMANERVMFWSGIPLLDVSESGVTGRVQVTELIKRKDGQGVRTLGWYYERFAEQDGVWRFAWHHFDLYYYGAPDLTGAITPWPDYGAAPAMPGPDAPTPERRWLEADHLPPPTHDERERRWRRRLVLETDAYPELASPTDRAANFGNTDAVASGTAHQR